MRRDVRLSGPVLSYPPRSTSLPPHDGGPAEPDYLWTCGARSPDGAGLRTAEAVVSLAAGTGAIAER